MTDLAISKALALAIGWKASYVMPNANTSQDMAQCWVYTGFRWRAFDYRDWNVIGPIAERYDCFPRKSDTQGWWLPHKFERAFVDTPQKAIALAVIGAKK